MLSQFKWLTIECYSFALIMIQQIVFFSFPSQLLLWQRVARIPFIAVDFMLIHVVMTFLPCYVNKQLITNFSKEHKGASVITEHYFQSVQT